MQHTGGAHYLKEGEKEAERTAELRSQWEEVSQAGERRLGGTGKGPCQSRRWRRAQCPCRQDQAHAAPLLPEPVIKPAVRTSRGGIN